MSNLFQIKPVKGSTAIQGMGYEPTTQTLAIQFAGGRLHHFKGVPPDVFDAFEKAPSKGVHYNAHIRDQFDSEPMDTYR